MRERLPLLPENCSTNRYMQTGVNQNQSVKPYRLGLDTAWNLMDKKNRKALLIIVGMSAQVTRKGDYKNGPNASFYCEHPWHWLPFEWQSRVYAYLVQLDRGR